MSLILKSLTTIVESSENDQRKKEHKWRHFQTLPLACGRRQKAKQKVLARWAPTAPAGSGWAQIPGAQLKNSSQAPGRELTKHLQQTFRKVCSSPFILLSCPKHVHPQAWLTFWLSAKESDPWSGRQTVWRENRQAEVTVNNSESNPVTGFSRDGPWNETLIFRVVQPQFLPSGLFLKCKALVFGKSKESAKVLPIRSLRFIVSVWGATGCGSSNLKWFFISV